MAPLPEHGRKVSVIADVVKVLLDHLGREYEHLPQSQWKYHRKVV